MMLTDCDFILVDQTGTYGNGAFGPDRYWAARCKLCGRWATKYDQTREESLAIAIESHDCRKGTHT